jgi:hypothetical protein
MLKYLGNNFVLAGVISLVLVIAVYIERRTSDKKNGHQSIKDWVFWAKLFGIGYVLVLVVLLMKDKCPLSGGSCSNGSGSCGFSLSSLKNKLPSASAPWGSSSGGGSSNAATSVSSPEVSVPPMNVRPQVQAPVVSKPADPGLKVIDLNNVNIGDPDF